MQLLHVKSLHYQRAERELFHGLSFTLARGQLLQITGENGVGKTTLLRLLAGFLPAPRHAIQRFAPCAYVGHQPGFTSGMTVRENLLFTARLYAQDKLHEKSAAQTVIEKLMIQFGLHHQADLPAAQLSAGQQRRLVFASLALMRAPLWLLDEPFTALDSLAVGLLKQLIAEHLQQGAVVLTTHHTSMQWQEINIQHLQLRENTCGMFI